MNNTNYCNDGYLRLAAAVVELAVKDYINALRRLHRKPYDENARRMADECERFFKKEVETYTDIDGQAIIKAIRKRVDEEHGDGRKRDERKCIVKI